MIKKILLLTLISSWLISCTIYRDYQIDIYKPGETAIDPEVKNLAIISRNFKYSADTLQHFLKKDNLLAKDLKNAHLNIDSLAVASTLMGLTNQLHSSGKYSRINMWPYPTVKPHTGDKISIYSPEFIHNLTEPTDAHLLISLETLSYFFNSYSETEYDPAASEVITASVWGIYQAETGKLMENKQLIDTFYWNGYDPVTGIQNSRIPERLDAIQVACEMTGERYAKRLSPSWQQVNRMYLIPPVEDFRIAAAYFEEGEWNKAINAWEIYAPDRFRKLAIDAQFNIALAYEMKDELEKALDWIYKAERLAVSIKSREDLKMILNYKRVLTDRLEELKRLNLQP